MYQFKSIDHNQTWQLIWKIIHLFLRDEEDLLNYRYVFRTVLHLTLVPKTFQTGVSGLCCIMVVFYWAKGKIIEMYLKVFELQMWNKNGKSIYNPFLLFHFSVVLKFPHHFHDLLLFVCKRELFFLLLWNRKYCENLDSWLLEECYWVWGWEY